MDDAELKAQVARAEADRDLAQQSLARTKDLLAQKASSQSELERADATARSNEAQLDLLKVRLARTTVRAPFAGVVGQRLVSLGDYVTTDTRLVSLQTVSPQRAAFQVPERYADQLKMGQQVTFRVAALPGREFTGRVDFVDPVVQLPGRTITVKAVTPNPKRALQPGMFIEARLATAVRPKRRRHSGGRRRRAPGLDLRVGRASGQGHAPPGGPRRPHAGLRRGAERRRALPSRSWSAARSGWPRARRWLPRSWTGNPVRPQES